MNWKKFSKEVEKERLKRALILRAAKDKNLKIEDIGDEVKVSGLIKAFTDKFTNKGSSDGNKIIGTALTDSDEDGVVTVKLGDKKLSKEEVEIWAKFAKDPNSIDIVGELHKLRVTAQLGKKILQPQGLVLDLTAEEMLIILESVWDRELTAKEALEDHILLFQTRNRK